MQTTRRGFFEWIAGLSAVLMGMSSADRARHSVETRPRRGLIGELSDGLTAVGAASHDGHTGGVTSLLRVK